MKNNIHHRFASLDLLLFLINKIKGFFHPQVFIYERLSQALENSSMIGILGREGMGKSSAISKFLYDKKGVYYVRIGQSYRVGNFLDEMIFQLSGAYPSDQSLFLKVKKISALLTKDDSKKLIIVDDSGKLSPRGLGFFHELRENTIHCAGFAFVGLPYFKANLIKAKGKQVTGVAEFFRRVQSWFEIPGLQENEPAEFAKLAGLNGIQTELLNCMVLFGEVVTLSEVENSCAKISQLNDKAVQDLIKSYQTGGVASKKNANADGTRPPVKRRSKKTGKKFDTESEFEEH